MRARRLHRRLLRRRRLQRRREARRARGRAARQPRLWQPARRRRPAPRPDGPGPRLRRRPGRAALSPPRRPRRPRLRPGRQPRHAHPGPRQRRGRRGHERDLPARPHRGHPLPTAVVDVVISNCVINLSTDKPAVLAEAFRVLRPGGRLGISDVIADEGLDATARTAAEHRVGCANGTLTAGRYEHLLQAAGFTGVRITLTTDAGDGLHSAIVQAAKPDAAPASPGSPI
ncbi:methyltransferase domain-containing protein [Nonomuraea thailandensis]